jgi:hypothetical protein
MQPSGRKDLPRTNTLAYLVSLSVMKKIKTYQAPMMYAASRPSCEKTLAAEQRLARMEG